MEVIKGISLNDVQKAKDILLKDTDTMKVIRYRLKKRRCSTTRTE